MKKFLSHDHQDLMEFIENMKERINKTIEQARDYLQRQILPELEKIFSKTESL